MPPRRAPASPAKVAVALSQHGTVAPVTIHHRVDFAASMIDGRTVGEVVPNSRLGQRDQRSVALYPGAAVAHRARSRAAARGAARAIWPINSLLSPDAGRARWMHLPPPVLEPPVYDGPERRLGIDRRALRRAAASRTPRRGLRPPRQPTSSMGAVNEQRPNLHPSPPACWPARVRPSPGAAGSCRQAPLALAQRRACRRRLRRRRHRRPRTGPVRCACRRMTMSGWAFWRSKAVSRASNC